ncbi:MAG: hypothetical protein Tsb009_37190 [Planctomycetaceae bacterium]
MTKLAPKKNPTGSRKKKKRLLRRLVEFKGFNRISLRQYRENVRQLYDGPAGAMLALGSMISLHEPLVGHVFRSGKFNVRKHASILDVGSGAGQILRHLIKETESETRLIGFDLSPGMLRRARHRMKNNRPCYIAGDMMRMPFAENSFDCVTAGWVLEHLPDPKPGLQEIARVLKPNGSALILATEDTLSGAVVSRTWKCRTYNRKELESACKEVGLPWRRQLWFTRFHRFFKMGGILVEATKPENESQT